MNIEHKDICPFLHALNDFGYQLNKGYSRPHTYDLECYAEICYKKGQCIKVRTQKIKNMLNSTRRKQNENNNLPIMRNEK